MAPFEDSFDPGTREKRRKDPFPEGEAGRVLGAVLGAEGFSKGLKDELGVVAPEGVDT